MVSIVLSPFVTSEASMPNPLRVAKNEPIVSPVEIYAVYFTPLL